MRKLLKSRVVEALKEICSFEVDLQNYDPDIIISSWEIYETLTGSSGFIDHKSLKEVIFSDEIDNDIMMIGETLANTIELFDQDDTLMSKSDEFGQIALYAKRVLDAIG